MSPFPLSVELNLSYFGATDSFASLGAPSEPCPPVSSLPPPRTFLSRLDPTPPSILWNPVPPLSYPLPLPLTFYFQSHRSFLTSDKHPQVNHTLKVNRIPFQTLDPFPTSPSLPSFWEGSLLLESAFSLPPPHWTQSAGPHVTAHCSLVANQGPHPLGLSVSHRTYMHKIQVQ